MPEALAGHRLILANHAMLLAHLDDLGRLGDDTLLIVDEAHQLEDAATSALTTSWTTRRSKTCSLSSACVAGREPHLAEWAAVAEAVRNLGILLDHEQLPKVAGQAFDARSAGVGALIGSRAVTLASPYVGTAGMPQVRTLAALLTRLGGVCRAVTGALGAFLAANGTALDFFAAERLHALIAKTKATRRLRHAIVTDIVADIGRPPGRSPRPDAAGGLAGRRRYGASGSQPVATTTTTYVAPTRTIDAATSDGEDRPTQTPRRVRHRARSQRRADEPGRLRRGDRGAARSGLRRYRFRIATSPIELPADPTWRLFLTTFTRTYYVSATLRVAGEWTFLRDRLGIDPGVPTLVLDYPVRPGEPGRACLLFRFPVLGGASPTERCAPPPTS